LADQLAVPQVLGLLDEHVESGRAMLFFVSFYTPDHVGEAVGPHGDGLRDQLVELDGYLAKFLERLDEKGIRNQSLIIITADHGMELQDKNRSVSWKPAMEQTGVKYVDPDGFGFVYLHALRVSCSVDCPDQACQLNLEVVDDDLQGPLAGASVTVLAPPCDGCTTTTGEEGEALLELPFAGPVDVEVTHQAFNPAHVTCQ